ncbi:MAG: hypothetical protein AABW67_00280 [Nanoarchaeota archaeon]
MMSWIVIIVLLVIAFFVLRINHLKHRFWIIMLVLFALFLYTTISIVNNANSFDLSSTSGFFDAAKIYLGWLGSGFQNLKVLSGNAVKMDWTKTNGSFLDNKDTIQNKPIK